MLGKKPLLAGWGEDPRTKGKNPREQEREPQQIPPTYGVAPGISTQAITAPQHFTVHCCLTIHQFIINNERRKKSPTTDAVQILLHCFSALCVSRRS